MIKSWETVEKHAMEIFYRCITFLREVLYSSYVQIISLNEQWLPSKVFKLDNTNSILDIMCAEKTPWVLPSVISSAYTNPTIA